MNIDCATAKLSCLLHLHGSCILKDNTPSYTSDTLKSSSNTTLSNISVSDSITTYLNTLRKWTLRMLSIPRSCVVLCWSRIICEKSRKKVPIWIWPREHQRATSSESYINWTEIEYIILKLILSVLSNNEKLRVRHCHDEKLCPIFARGEHLGHIWSLRSNQYNCLTVTSFINPYIHMKTVEFHS